MIKTLSVPDSKLFLSENAHISGELTVFFYCMDGWKNWLLCLSTVVVGHKSIQFDECPGLFHEKNLVKLEWGSCYAPIPCLQWRLSLLMVPLALSRSDVKALPTALFRQQRLRLLTRTQTEIHREEEEKGLDDEWRKDPFGGSSVLTWK